jgi:hypothetical protein
MFSVTYHRLLPSHLRLGLSRRLFASGFPTNILYGFLIFPMRATFPAHLIPLDLKLSIMQSSPDYLHSFPLWSMHSPNIIFS